MSHFQAFLYGLIQGLGEFLPISSSAHLEILHKIFGENAYDLAFDVTLHLGTLLAVLLFFWKDWLRLTIAGFTKPNTNDCKLFWYIAIASVPGAVFGVALESKAETLFRHTWLIGLMLIIMGIVLYYVDKVSKKNLPVEKITFSKSLWIGICQALAIIPGVSRSGITMSTGLILGLTREGAARFSFLLSTPIIVGAGIYKIKALLHANIDPLTFTIGILTSAIVGFLSIKFILNYLKNKGYGIFVVYRIILGILLIGLNVFNILK